MSIRKILRRVMSRVLISAILFTQLAVAAYACPALAPTSAAFYAIAADAAEATSARCADHASGAPMPCDPANPDAPALCAEHCKSAQYSLDRAEVPPIAPALPNTLGLVIPPPETVPFSPIIAIRPAPPAPASHAVLHCSFLI